MLMQHRHSDTALPEAAGKGVYLPSRRRRAPGSLSLGPWGRFLLLKPQESLNHFPHRSLCLQVPRTRAARCLVVK